MITIVNNVLTTYIVSGPLFLRVRHESPRRGMSRSDRINGYPANI
jgi:hypothetical protein